MNDSGAAWPSTLRVLDRTGLIGYEPVLAAFARDELLCRQVGQGAAPLVHVWRHPRAFVMGLRDSRLPNAEKAIAWLRELGYSAAVRNSGGAAVPLDLGVLNVSLIMPKPGGRLEFRHDFERMVQLLRESYALRTDKIEQGEVTGSYCPGEYDLSIGGRKFCGIAQRRHANAIVVQAFIVVEGLGAERAAMARAFYEKAAGDTDAEYPHVCPDKMGSLSEMLPAPLTAVDAARDILSYLSSVSELSSIEESDLLAESAVQTAVLELEARYSRE